MEVFLTFAMTMKKQRKFFIVFLTFCACTGSLTEEQRKAVKEDMAAHKITRVTDAEITEAAFAKGRSLVDQLAALRSDTVREDSMISASQHRIRFSFPGDQKSSEIETQIVQAFLEVEDHDAGDNIQKSRRADNSESDSILYSKPVYTVSQQKHKLKGVWNIWLSRKALILAMNKK